MTRRASLTGISTDAPGFRGVRNTRHIHEIRLPSGSIAPLEDIDLSQASFHSALMFALPVSILLWILIGLATWFLISVFL